MILVATSPASRLRGACLPAALGRLCAAVPHAIHHEDGGKDPHPHNRIGAA
jgi:hypothetical protein